MLVAGFLAITVNGLAAYLLNQPLLFSGLAEQLFQKAMQTETPEQEGLIDKVKKARDKLQGQ